MTHITVRVIFLTAIIAAIHLCGAAQAAVTVGQPAPELKVSALDGKPFVLTDHRGHVVIVNFWATWCGPCQREMPTLDKFYRDHIGQGVELIGLSADRNQDRDKVAKVMAAFHYPAAMLSDAKPNGFGSPAVLPITYVIDAAGIVRAQLKPQDTGLDEKTLSDAISPLLSPAGH